MTDTEFDLLVTIAQAPPEGRNALLAARQPPLSGELRTSTAYEVLSLLRGEPARGTAAHAWLALVTQEAKRLTRRKAVAG